MTSGTLSVGRVADLSAMARMRAEWSELLDASDAGLFNAWEWLYPWCRRLAPERELYILAARDAVGALVGLMPLGLERRRVLGRRVRRLAFLGETVVGSDYLDVIARRGLEDAVGRAFAQELRAMRGAWDALDLLDLREDSPTVEHLRDAFRDRDVRVSERYVCPYETFTPGEAFDAFVSRTGRRDNLRRQKRLEKQEGYVIERTVAPGDLAAPLSEFFRLHAARWAGEGGSQAIASARVEAFHRDATYLFAERGWLRLYTMKIAGRAVASVYGLLYRGAFLYYQSGYDPAWRNHSVGMILLGETFKDAIETGLVEYDFLRGPEPYKLEWTTRERRTVAVRVPGAGGRGQWLTRGEELARRARLIAARVLPPETAERIRRMRRRRAST